MSGTLSQGLMTLLCIVKAPPGLTYLLTSLISLVMYGMVMLDITNFVGFDHIMKHILAVYKNTYVKKI